VQISSRSILFESIAEKRIENSKSIAIILEYAASPVVIARVGSRETEIGTAEPVRIGVAGVPPAYRNMTRRSRFGPMNLDESDSNGSARAL
jgi:hypothetical protein